MPSATSRIASFCSVSISSGETSGLRTLAQAHRALSKGDLDAAEPLLSEALEGMRETLGIRHPSTLIAMRSVLTVLTAMRDHMLTARYAAEGQG